MVYGPLQCQHKELRRKLNAHVSLFNINEILSFKTWLYKISKAHSLKFIQGSISSTPILTVLCDYCLGEVLGLG